MKAAFEVELPWWWDREIPVSLPSDAEVIGVMWPGEFARYFKLIVLGDNNEYRDRKFVLRRSGEEIPANVCRYVGWAKSIIMIHVFEVR